MTDEVKSAVFGNVGTMITFRVGATDAEVFEKEFAPYFILDDFVNLSAYQIYLRLMIDSQGSKPFSAHTLDPIQKPAHSHMQAVIANSRAMYAKPKFVAEEEIAEFYKPIAKEEKKQLPYTPKTESTSYQPAQAPQKSFSPKSVYPPAPKPKEEKESFQEEIPKREEKRLPIRKITNDTPLPPRRFEPRARDSSSIVEEKKDSYTETRKIEEEFHRPPSLSSHNRKHQGYAQTQSESSLQKISAPVFDDKPAVSLKDALAKAMNEHKDDEEKKRKEVAEDVLRKLIED